MSTAQTAGQSAAGTTHDHAWVMARAEEVRAAGPTPMRAGRDPVNQPMVNNWLEAMGNTNPRFLGGEAPPTMAQVWTMKGLHPAEAVHDPLHAMMGHLTDAGFTGVLGTNCEQHYDRYLRVGEQVSVSTELESVVGPKQTGVGEGYFVTSRNVWTVEAPDGTREQVATMTFRVLKFRPRPPAPRNDFVLYPTRNRDTDYFWEGTAEGELRIQKCGSCDALRHPPGPACPECGALDRTHVVSTGRGTVFSYVVHRHPPIPGHELPIPLALVDLEEGVRMLATVDGVEPDQLEIGMPVEAGFRRIDDSLTLPVWRRPGSGEDTAAPPGPVDVPVVDGAESLPEWRLAVTPTLVVSTALATRDFQDVHHDKALAQSYGQRDIFVNILTSNGLVERYVTEWAGNDARISSIAIRLGAPAYPGDELVFNGSVRSVEGRSMVVEVVGAVESGAHVTGTVTMEVDR